MSLQYRIFLVILNIIAFLINTVTNLVISRKKPNYPSIKYHTLRKPVSVLRKELKQKKLTSTALVKVYIERIKEVNTYLNCVVEDRFNEALKEARHADLLISKADNDAKLLLLFQRYPLLGIPFSVKEACGVKGLSYAVGCLNRQNEKCPKNGKVVELLKAAGGIPLLVSANPEYCLAFEADTHINGKCLNPYDLRRSSGGSSSGEGSLNGAGATPFGIGSDICGSIRLPAFYCGVFGHKPTGGLVSIQGHFPYSTKDAEFSNFLQMGPITRFAQDLPLIMQIIADKNAEKLGFEEGINLNDIKIYYTFSMGKFLHLPVDYEIKSAIERAVTFFEKEGLRAVEVEIDGFKNAFEMTLSYLVSIKGIPSLLTNSVEVRPSRRDLVEEIVKSITGYSKITISPLLAEYMIEANGFLSDRRSEKLRTKYKKLREYLIEFLGSNGVLFIPTYHKSANFFNICCLANTSGVILTLMFNILGFPATHVPMGLDRNCLPIGFQVVAAPYMDKLCLKIAGVLEREFGGWIEP